MRWSSHVAGVLGTLLVMSAVLTGCGKTPTPEAQVRATISRAELAAENKDVAVLRGLISDKYRDPQGQDKRAVETLLRVYFLRNESIHVFARVHRVSVLDNDRAEAVVLAAMAAQPVTDARELERLRADLYRFEITFYKEAKEWRVVSAQWRPAELGEFF